MLQQNTYTLLSLKSDAIVVKIVLLLFTSGILTSLNPCLLSILPITLSYLCIQDKHNYQKTIFVLGFMSSLILMTFFTFIFNRQYHLISNFVPLISSLILILISLNLMHILQFKISFLDKEKLDLFAMNSSVKNYMLGLIIGFSASPCSTPILLAIVWWLSHAHHFALALIYLCCYILGYVVPVIFLVYVSLQYHQMKIISQLWDYLTPVSGSILLGFGIFSLLEKIIL